MMRQVISGFLGIALAGILLLPPAPAVAVDAQKKGRDIAIEVDRRDEGFGDSRAQLRMILKDRGGRQSVRDFRMLTLEVTGRNNGDKTLVRFSEPQDIAGTTLLNFSHFQGNDEQWLYLPALRRIKRISSNNKSGPFVGSEFAYEDMLSQENRRFRHKWLRDETCGEGGCFVVERRPVDGNSGYSRQIVWIDRQHYRPVRIDYYDRRNALLKTLRYGDYRLLEGRYWRAHELVMRNRQSGKSTVLRISQYDISVGLDAAQFQPRRLRTQH